MPTPKENREFFEKHVTYNKAELMRSQKAGCYHCLRIFLPSEIKEWEKNKNGDTAYCPHCGIDTVYGDASGTQVDMENLKDKQHMKMVEDSENITFLGKTFGCASQLTSFNGQTFMEYVLGEETVENWSEMITYTYDVGLQGKATQENVDAVTKTTLASFKEKAGGFVYSSFSLQDSDTGKIDNIIVAVFTVPESKGGETRGSNAMEVDLKRIFLKDGNVADMTYRVLLKGENKNDIEAKVNKLFSKSKDIAEKLAEVWV